MASIIVKATGQEIEVALYPVWGSGTWECGDARFTDVDKTKYAPKELSWADAAPDYFWISVGAFYDRFGDKMLDVTSSDDAQVQGAIRICAPRQYIDLKRADVSQIVGMIQAKGIISVDEMNAVLKQETTEDERVVKGMPQPV